MPTQQTMTKMMERSTPQITHGWTRHLLRSFQHFSRRTIGKRQQ